MHFFHIFLNMNISVTINPTHFKFSYSIRNICMEGILSQSFDKAQTFCFMKCGILYFEKLEKYSRFFS